MLRNLWFQLHWLLGIAASVVLAIVGVTGALLSFEDDILRALNPGIITVPLPAAAAPLEPASLAARIQASAPGRRITALTVSGAPDDAARVTFAPNAGAPGRGETRYVDPYAGTILDPPRGLESFRFIMRLHRWLALDDPGKHIVGAATMALVVLALSGLYLRWPRRPLDWRAWLRVDFKRRGRNLLWDLHAVAGTVAVVPYLVMGLTGLYWSYGWYRGALFDLAGMPPPGGERAGGPPNAARRGDERPAALGADAVWKVFRREVPAYGVATLRWPARPGQPYQVSYRLPDAPHDRANNTLVLDPATGAVREHRLYAALPLGQKLLTGIFALHSGSFFGLTGVVLFMLASLAMPLFAVTGWMLYLDRRARKRAVRAATRPLPAEPAASAPILIGFAGQSGTAERLAWQSAATLSGAGLAVAVTPLWRLDPSRLGATTRALFIVSTFGDGQPPDRMRGFARGIMRQSLPMSGMSFGLLALGDRSYQRFCGFGRDFESWLRRQGARPLFDRVDVDNSDAGALRHWQGHLGRLADRADLPDWEAPRYQDWRLAERRLGNDGSVGWPCFHIELAPPDPGHIDWQAGDIAEIGPAHGAARVASFLAEAGMDGTVAVTWDGLTCTLADTVARSILPPATPRQAVTAQALADCLQPLPHREYSIASLPQDGRIHLLVRQMRDAQGRSGIGSGWLTREAPVGAGIAVRVRRNAGFHAPGADRPLLLIGNGTGIAGLRAHLKDRVLKDRPRNWLIFGERNQAHDFHYADDIAAWRAAGMIERLDLAFSRDQKARIHVQDRLRDAAAALRAWVDDGAAIYVCGSLEGMAPAVDATLADLLGAAVLERMAAEGLYRRDVY
ncbi:sulfite reductase flavoprotein subunit alpha [Vineibacter terrae]|uniref:sulfite reductase flavoprotein subunit alpha n=1 Tax=Vineibacter terrae TaxID=2586908 RepID=UPI002E2F1670|nr:sulfite reductase flavoprotein subunit alpha [Vineibacter terrae]HEX2891211.1 sulfite reductase flavoprotein subunit alpha [Vineibacter terrae]